MGANSNGTTGGEITLNNATAGSPAEFLVDAAFVIANVNKEIRLSYSLIPANGGSPRYSERLTVTVGAVLSLLRPEVLEAHRYPDQLVPEAVLNGATIVVTFPQMLPSHRIRACWTGIPGIGTYCETQDGNTSKTVHFHVDPEVIGANLQPYGHFIDVQYFVLLGVHEKASPILSLELLPAVLPQPYLEGHLNTGVLDISALTGTERAIVNIWHFIHRYQRMWFYLSGTYASGYPFSYTFYDGDLVTRDGEQTGVHTPAPVAELRQLLDGSQLIMSFGVAFDQSTVEANAVWFPERSYTVQAIPAEFPVPRLLQASGSGAAVTLKALDAQNGATIEVAFAPMYTTDTITVEVLGTSGQGSAILGPKKGEQDGTVTFDVLPTLIAANLGNANTRFTVKYTVMRNGISRPSTTLTVKLTPIPLTELQKTVIRIDEAVNGILDVDQLIGNATARVGTWPFIQNKQPVWLYLLGNTSTGTALNLTLWNGASGSQVNPTWISQGFDQSPILYSYLKNLGNNSLLTLRFKAALDGSMDESRAIVFPDVRYSIRNQLIVDLTTFDNYYWNNWTSTTPKTDVQREVNGNYYLQITATHGVTMFLIKTFSPAVVGYYRLSGRFRMPRFGTTPPTELTIFINSERKFHIPVNQINTWLYFNQYLGYLPNKPFQISILVGYPSINNTLYDFDDLKLEQRTVPF